MRIASYVQDSIVDGKGLRFTLFTQGCPHSCPGCHNPQTHDFSGGLEISPEELVSIILKNPLTDGVTFSGGEPFAQASDCAQIARAVREKGLNIWAYSSWTFEQLLAGTQEQRELLELCDVLVVGPFILAQRSLSLKWRGSTNQRVLDVPKSLALGQAVELD